MGVGAMGVGAMGVGAMGVGAMGETARFLCPCGQKCSVRRGRKVGTEGAHSADLGRAML